MKKRDQTEKIAEMRREEEARETKGRILITIDETRNNSVNTTKKRTKKNEKKKDEKNRTKMREK